MQELIRVVMFFILWISFFTLMPLLWRMEMVSLLKTFFGLIFNHVDLIFEGLFIAIGLLLSIRVVFVVSFMLMVSSLMLFGLFSSAVMVFGFISYELEVATSCWGSFIFPVTVIAMSMVLVSFVGGVVSLGMIGIWVILVVSLLAVQVSGSTILVFISSVPVFFGSIPVSIGSVLVFISSVPVFIGSIPVSIGSILVFISSVPVLISRVQVTHSSIPEGWVVVMIRLIWCFVKHLLSLCDRGEDGEGKVAEH